MKLKNISDIEKIYLGLASLSSFLMIIWAIQRIIYYKSYIGGVISIIIAIGSIITLLKSFKENKIE